MLFREGTKSELRNPKQIQDSKEGMSGTAGREKDASSPLLRFLPFFFGFRIRFGFRASNFGFFLGLFLAGCGSAHVAAPLTSAGLGTNDPHARMEFWYQLARRPVVSNDEALHA